MTKNIHIIFFSTLRMSAPLCYLFVDAAPAFLAKDRLWLASVIWAGCLTRRLGVRSGSLPWLSPSLFLTVVGACLECVPHCCHHYHVLRTSQSRFPRYLLLLRLPDTVAKAPG